MAKDYHKGKKLQCYIPEEVNNMLNENAAKYKVTRTQIIIDALYSFIGNAARNSIEKSYNDITSSN